MDAERLLLAHDELWESRARVLGEWRSGVGRRQQVLDQQRRHKAFREAALVRASAGLTARQREWAQRNAMRAVSRRRERGLRDTAVKWAYYRQRVETTTAKWAAVIEADDRLVTGANRTVAELTSRLIATWGKDAPNATGQTIRQLRALARQDRASG